MSWQPIDTAPKERDERGHRPQVLLIGAYPAGLGSTVWSDIRHGWWDEPCEKWERWPHWFPPSHWMPLPTPPEDPAP